MNLVDQDLIVAVLAWLTLARFTLVTLSSIVEYAVEASPSVRDNERWRRIQGNFYWLLVSRFLEVAVGWRLPAATAKQKTDDGGQKSL